MSYPFLNERNGNAGYKGFYYKHKIVNVLGSNGKA